MVSKNESKFIKSLKIKKYRVREHRFLVEGTKNVLELLSSDFVVELIVATKPFLTDHEISSTVRIEEVSEKELADLSTLQATNSCLAVARTKGFSLTEIDFEQTVFILDGVNDPGNLGAIIRTLDWFGFSQLICLPNTAEFYNPKVISSTMGSFTRSKVVYEDWGNIHGEIKGPIYGAEMDGKSIFDTEIVRGSVIVMGSESHGLSTESKKHIQHCIHIPQFGSAESLNVGVATGIIAAQLRIS